MKRLRIALAASISIVSAGFSFTQSAHAVDWNAYTYAPAATLAGARGLQTITERVAKSLTSQLAQLTNLSVPELLTQRDQKYRSNGSVSGLVETPQ